MKVIENGKDETFRIRCYDCNSILEFTREDTFEHAIYFGTHLTITTSVTCPVCSLITKAFN